MLRSSQSCSNSKKELDYADPTKAKMRRRVCRLREVRRGVRAQQVKCLIVAPNVSDGEELQRQITEILDGAAAAKIPVAFAFGKRRLGRPCGSNRVQYWPSTPTTARWMNIGPSSSGWTRYC